jgi:hypothetical protein
MWWFQSRKCTLQFPLEGLCLGPSRRSCCGPRDLGLTHSSGSGPRSLSLFYADTPGSILAADSRYDLAYGSCFGEFTRPSLRTLQLCRRWCRPSVLGYSSRPRSRRR